MREHEDHMEYEDPPGDQSEDPLEREENMAEYEDPIMGEHVQPREWHQIEDPIEIEKSMSKCEDATVGNPVQSGDVSPQESELHGNEDQDMNDHGAPNDSRMHEIGSKDPP